MNKKDRPYTIEPYNPEWKNIFQREKEVLEKILGSIALRIEHIGSTSVEGLWAKPQIDILVVLGSLEKIDKIEDEMKLAGYNFQDSYNQFDERYFTRDNPNGERIVSIHIRTEDNPQTYSSIYLRDYLRKHPDECDLYSKNKIAAYNNGQADRVQYSKNKKEILMQIMERAERWHSTQDK